MGAVSDGNVFYIDDIDEDFWKDIAMPLHKAVKIESEKAFGCITMYVNSWGGYAHEAFHVIEMMEMAKRLDVVVRTVVTDVAYSAGSIISVAGSEGERYAAPGSTFLIHYGSSWDFNETPKQVERNHNLTKSHFKRMHDHYEKYCDIPDLDEQISDDLWWIDARKAKRYKMYDHPIDKFDPRL